MGLEHMCKLSWLSMAIYIPYYHKLACHPRFWPLESVHFLLVAIFLPKGDSQPVCSILAVQKLPPRRQEAMRKNTAGNII
jgi:hypothetical protein